MAPTPPPRRPRNSKASSSRIRNPDGFSYRQMFQKELTPSDVGNLNRLVIPKKYTIQFFPRISEKELNAGDVVGFFECVYRDQGGEGMTFCMVDVIKRETGSVVVDGSSVKGEVDEDIGDKAGCLKEEMDLAVVKIEKQHGGFGLFGVDIK